MDESLATFSISSTAQVEATELEGVPDFARVPEKQKKTSVFSQGE
jgi:hypothetical protein